MTTDFLKLVLTDKSEVSMNFLDWRTIINGTSESNMILIDRAVSLLNDAVEGKADGFSYNPDTGRLYLTTNGVNINGAFVDIKLKDCYTKDEVDEIIDNLANSDALQNLKNSVYTKEEVHGITDPLTRVVENLQQELNNLDVEGYTYYATYGEAVLPSGETAENVYTLWEVKDNQEQVKSQFVLAGGGGNIVTTNLVVERITPSPLILTPTDPASLQFSYSSTDGDGEQIDGSYTLKLGSSTIASGYCVHGVNTIDISENVSIGTQKFTLTVFDEGGSISVKSWTVQVVDVRIESTFSDRIKYVANNTVNFTYTPYGSISKTVHFILDGEELESVVTSASGTMQSYTLPAKSHGAHLLECYITATVNSIDIETDHIFRDIIYFDDDSDIPVIGCIYRYDYYGKVPSRQYSANNIVYHIFDPNTNSPTVTHVADNTVISTQTMTSSSNTWSYKTDIIGDHTLVISCRDTSVVIIMDVAELGINVNPVTANLAFDFNPIGMSNNSADRLWRDKNSDVHMTVSDNFDWSNGGYHLDNEGNQYFCVKAGTYATIHYNLFGLDASKQGAEFKLIFKTGNVRDIDATFLQCISGTIPVGIKMNAHAAYIHTSATGEKPLYIPYSEDDVIEFEYNINPLDSENAEATSVIMSYEDGVAFRPLIYDAGHRVYQYSADMVPITIGSEDCDIYIYRMKAYTSSLTDIDILANFIADARDSDTMISRYDRNQIYNENNILTPESVAAACPDLKIIKIDCPYFTQDKNEMIKNTIIECIHKGGDPVLDNWRAVNCYHSGQGTTSNEYGFAGRNLNLYMCFNGEYTHKRVTYDPDYITTLTMGDGTKYSDGNGKVTITRTSVPNSLFNIKVNIASSENANNAILARRYNRYLPYSPVGARRDPNVKTTMEFANCVVFIRENDPDVSTHREFDDTEWHFYAIGNIGDSKDTDQTRAYNPDDHNEFVIEIADNTKLNSIFPSGVTDETGKYIYPISKDQWCPGNPKYDSLHNEWDDTFEFRYEHPDITDEESAANIQIFNDFYEWIITSTDEEFVSELKNWVIEEAALYAYLFTERYTMIDNRAKNTFWHYAKMYISQAEATAMGEDLASRYVIDDDAAAIRNGYRFDWWDYDNDTALGINNSGEMTMTYGKEDVDYRTDGDPNSGYIYNAAESAFFCRIRDLMYPQLQSVYLSCESFGAWSSDSLIQEFEKWQSQFPEELWRLDIERKYYRTYQAGTRRFLETMLNGRKWYHRRQWDRDQEAYISTKYVGANVKADQIMFRCNTPQQSVVDPNYDLKIVPYSDMYLSVLYGNSLSPIQIRAKAGMEYEIKNPLGNTMDDTAILIYCASRIMALNDLSGCYIHDNDFSKAQKIQQLVIGNNTTGYQNNFMTSLNIGNNPLLKLLDIRNCPNLVGSVNLSECGNLVELYANGSAITGVIFSPNGKVTTAYLPQTVNTLVMKDLNYLTNLNATYDNLESLTEERSIVDELSIVRDAVDTLQTLRLSGINWVLEDTSLMNAIAQMDSSTMSGEVYVPIIRNSELDLYRDLWPDLVIKYGTLIPQYIVKFLNWDGTLLYQTYVDRGGTAYDPVEAGLIEAPTKESSISTVYSFAGWDSGFSAVIAPVTYTAIYNESTRKYTVRWFSQANTIVDEQYVDYGSEAVYSGEIPEFTGEEHLYIYYLFDGWDKSTGCITGDIDVYALWQRGELPPSGTDIKNMSPTQIYAVIRNGRASEYFALKDRVPIIFGFSPQYTNIPYEDFANEEKFDGTNYIDTGRQLFKDGNNDAWTIVADMTIDKIDSGQTMVCCMQEDGRMGFKIGYICEYTNGGHPRVIWGTDGCTGSVISYQAKLHREIVVIRHEAGSKDVKVYFSDNYNDNVRLRELTKTIDTTGNGTLVFGAEKLDNGTYRDFAKGTLHSFRIWYGDLGDADCRKIASWPRETHFYEVGGFGDYKITDDGDVSTSVDFISENLLNWDIQLHPSAKGKVKGFGDTYAFDWMQNRLYNALPEIWRKMIKQCRINNVYYVDGTNYKIESINAYIWIPSAVEMNNSTQEPWIYEGKWIKYMIDNGSRTKFTGATLFDGYSYFESDGVDPAINPDNNVKDGDVWYNKGAYKYFRKNGEWIPSSAYWLRSATYLSYENSFGMVYGAGPVAVNQYLDASYYSGLCTRFSI